MSQFIKSAVLFCCPIVFTIFCMELAIILRPSTFNLKSKYFNSNVEDIEILILGSSHNQNAINPKMLRYKAANLAFGSQDTQLDSAIFFTHIGRMPKLKYLILEIDYHTLERKNENNYFRLPWYYKYYNIQIYPISLIDKLSLYMSSPKFFNGVIFRSINPLEYRYVINECGFLENDFPGVFKNLEYDSLEIEKVMHRLPQQDTIVSVENYTFNKNKINSMIDYCINKNIKVILLSSPVFVTYVRGQKPEKNMRKQNYIKTIVDMSNVFYYDFESNNKFTVRDFKNEDHLNSLGAKKYSVIINDLIEHIEFKK